jgi:hypothetical protein
MKRHGLLWTVVLWSWLRLAGIVHALTADEVMARVQQQLAVPSEMAIGSMQTYVNDQPHRHYAFVLARQWQPETATESVRIDFDSPVALPDADSSLRAQNRYLLKRVGQALPTQWLYLPALRRVRIAPYHPAEPLLQTDEWFYDLTAISNLADYTYALADVTPETPSVVGTPRTEFVPYEHVLLACEQHGDTYVITALTAWTHGVPRTAQFSGYQELAPGRFRPQQLVIETQDAGRTTLTFTQWQFQAAGAELFTGTALETRSLTMTLPSPDTP